MTKLDAVNDVLRKLGYTPVAGLDTAGNSLASQAERYLDAADRKMQALGWHFNTKVDVTLTPDSGTSKIAVPAGTIFRLDTTGESAATDVRVVGGFLYDITNNVDTFTSSVLVTYVERLTFTDLPETFAQYAVSQGAFNFNRGHKKDAAADSMLTQEIRQGWANCKREDDELADINLLDTQDMVRMRGGRISGRYR